MVNVAEASKDESLEMTQNLLCMFAEGRDVTAERVKRRYIYIY